MKRADSHVTLPCDWGALGPCTRGSAPGTDQRSRPGRALCTHGEDALGAVVQLVLLIERQSRVEVALAHGLLLVEARHDVAFDGGFELHA